MNDCCCKCITKGCQCIHCRQDPSGLYYYESPHTGHRVEPASCFLHATFLSGIVENTGCSPSRNKDCYLYDNRETVLALLKPNTVSTSPFPLEFTTGQAGSPCIWSNFVCDENNLYGSNQRLFSDNSNVIDILYVGLGKVSGNYEMRAVFGEDVTTNNVAAGTWRYIFSTGSPDFLGSGAPDCMSFSGIILPFTQTVGIISGQNKCLFSGILINSYSGDFEHNSIGNSSPSVMTCPTGGPTIGTGQYLPYKFTVSFSGIQNGSGCSQCSGMNEKSYGLYYRSAYLWSTRNVAKESADNDSVPNAFPYKLADASRDNICVVCGDNTNNSYIHNANINFIEFFMSGANPCTGVGARLQIGSRTSAGSPTTRILNIWETVLPKTVLNELTELDLNTLNWTQTIHDTGKMFCNWSGAVGFIRQIDEVKVPCTGYPLHCNNCSHTPDRPSPEIMYVDLPNIISQSLYGSVIPFATGCQVNCTGDGNDILISSGTFALNSGVYRDSQGTVRCGWGYSGNFESSVCPNTNYGLFAHIITTAAIRVYISSSPASGGVGVSTMLYGWNGTGCMLQDCNNVSYNLTTSITSTGACVPFPGAARFYG